MEWKEIYEKIEKEIKIGTKIPKTDEWGGHLRDRI